MKILFVLSRYPWPINKGDKLRAYYQIKLLSRVNDLFMIALDKEIISDHNELKKYCKNVKVIQIPIIKSVFNLVRSFFSKLPFQVSFFYSKKNEKEILLYINSIRPDLIIFQLIRTAEYARKINDIPKVIDLVDVLSKGLDRRRKYSNLFLKYFMLWEKRKVSRYESDMDNIFNNAIIITEEDKKYLPIKIREKTFVVENGVDSNFYYPNNSTSEYDLLFSGNMSYAPNVDSAIFLAKKILPQLIEFKKDISLMLVGSNPSRKVKKLQNINIQVTGWVDDLRIYYSKAKIFIAPLRIGTGLQNKILEAMSMGIPCIISSLCARSFNRLTSKEAIVCNTPGEFINAVILLLESEEKRISLSSYARKYVIENYEWNSIANKLIKVIQSVDNSYP